MSLRKGNNNMGGAYGNSKKEINSLKAKIVVLESNQNGRRLVMNETGDFKNIEMNSETPFRLQVSDVESSSMVFEEDEEEVLKRELEAERQALEEKHNKRLNDLNAKKMRKNMTLIREEECRQLSIKEDQLMAEIGLLQANLDAIKREATEVMRGDHDDDLISKKTAAVSTPAIKTEIKTASAKSDGVRARNTQDRPKGDIYDLFTEPALIKCVMNAKEYFAKVIPDQKIIKYCKADGSFNDITDKGVLSHLTKTVKLAGGKQKDIADESEPAKSRTVWTKKDDWIKSCKGEQNLYSSAKNGWKETHYYDTKKNEWVCLLNVAYNGVKLN